MVVVSIVFIDSIICNILYVLSISVPTLRQSQNVSYPSKPTSESVLNQSEITSQAVCWSTTNQQFVYKWIDFLTGDLIHVLWQPMKCFHACHPMRLQPIKCLLTMWLDFVISWKPVIVFLCCTCKWILLRLLAMIYSVIHRNTYSYSVISVTNRPRLTQSRLVFQILVKLCIT